MQLLYGNDGVNYRLIDKSSEMTDGVQKTLLGSYSRYDFVTDPKAYSSIANEPEAITYVSTNLDNQLRNDQVVLCKTGHMRNFSSPSYYFHGLVSDVGADYYKEKFFEIFGFEFISDVDVNRYSGGAVEQYRFPIRNIPRKALTDEQLIVILASFMSNDKKGQKTRILCDATGDAYNQRSREILAAIYRYLPYELRKRYGFKSYTQDDKNLPARVAFVISPRNEVKDVSGYITLSETRADVKAAVEREFLEYAVYLVEGMNDEEREQHFETMSKLANNGYLKVRDCVDYYTNLKSWSSGTQEALLPDWIQYIDQNSFRKGPLYELLLKIIVAKVDNTYYNDYLFDKILDLYHENIYSLSPLAAKTMRFADCLDEIYIEPERFHCWYQSRLQEKIASLPREQRDSVVYMTKFYEDEITALRGVNIMCDELDILLQKEIRGLGKQIEGQSAALEEQKDGELAEMHRRISGCRSITDLLPVVDQICRGLQFEENRQALSADAEEWLLDHFPERFRSERELREYRDQLTALNEKMPISKYEGYRKVLDDEEQNLIRARMARVCVIRPGKVLASYRELVRNLAAGVLDQDDKLTMQLGDQAPREYKARTLLRVMEFILYPEDEAIDPPAIGWKKAILEEGMITAEHVEYLLNDPDADEAFVRRVVRFFLEEDSVHISGIYLARLIQKYRPEINAALRKQYADGGDEEYMFADELKVLASERGEKKAPKAPAPAPERGDGKSKKGGFGGFFGGGKW